MLDQSQTNQITASWSHSGDLAGSPHVLMRPKLFIDGNQWCCLYGENLQDGVAGFGDCPRTACDNFDRRWNWSQAQIDKYDAEKSACAEHSRLTPPPPTPGEVR